MNKEKKFKRKEDTKENSAPFVYPRKRTKGLTLHSLAFEGFKKKKAGDHRRQIFMSKYQKTFRPREQGKGKVVLHKPK